VKNNPGIPREKGLARPVRSGRMPLNMDMTRMPSQTSFHAASRALKRERSFELSLQALVKGIDAAGRRFEEATEIVEISAQEASFRLRTRLLVGAKVAIALAVPRTLILEKPLRLLVTGAAVSVRSEDDGGIRQFVSVRLDRAFRLRAEASAPA
jgi:hypothetical protein